MKLKPNANGSVNASGIHPVEQKNGKKIVYLVIAPPASGKTYLCEESSLKNKVAMQDGDLIPAVRGVYSYNKAVFGEQWWNKSTFAQTQDMSGMSQAWWSYYLQLDYGPEFTQTHMVVTAETKAAVVAALYVKSRPDTTLSFVLVHYDIPLSQHLSQMARRVAENAPNFKTRDEAVIRTMRIHLTDRLAPYHPYRAESEEDLYALVNLGAKPSFSIQK